MMTSSGVSDVALRPHFFPREYLSIFKDLNDHPNPIIIRHYHFLFLCRGRLSNLSFRSEPNNKLKNPRVGVSASAKYIVFFPFEI